MSVSKPTFLGHLTQELASKGWSEIISNLIVEGAHVDLYATKEKGLMSWRVFVCSSPRFIDQLTFKEYINLHGLFKERAEGSNEGFLLCVLAETGVSTDVIPKLKKYSKGNCLLYIIDSHASPEKALYTRITRFHSIGKELKNAVTHALSKAESNVQTPRPPEAQNACPFCGIETKPGDLYCSNCGKRISESEHSLPRFSYAQLPISESLHTKTIVIGYILALLGGFWAIAIGYTLNRMKKPDNKKHGKIILALAIIMLAFWILILFI